MVHGPEPFPVVSWEMIRTTLCILDLLVLGSHSTIIMQPSPLFVLLLRRQILEKLIKGPVHLERLHKESSTVGRARGN